MRTLILGGTGLISQEIARQLVRRGDAVAVLNRGRTAADLPESVERIIGDRGSLASLKPWLENSRLDCVIDMIGYTAEDAAGLAAFSAGEVNHVIYCSTVDVFAKPQLSYPVREDAPRSARPGFPYAVGKVESELLLQRAARDGAFSLTILRPAQTYGGPDHGPVHPLGHRDYQLWRLATARPILLHGDGTSLWSACHARDVAAAFVAAVHEPAARGRSYNLASAELVTWQRYWEIVSAAFTGQLASVVALPSEVLGRLFGADGVWLMENFRYNNVFDCHAAASDLDFSSRTTLADGMSELAARFGPHWLQQGETEAGSQYDRRYEETLSWWHRLA